MQLKAATSQYAIVEYILICIFRQSFDSIPIPKCAIQSKIEWDDILRITHLYA